MVLLWRIPLQKAQWIPRYGQIYLRIGATFKLLKYFDLTAGFVNPYYWDPDQSDPNVNKIVPQYRL